MSVSPSRPAVKPTPVQKLLLIIVGVALGAAYWWASINGVMERWQKLAAPPGKIAELVTLIGSVYVRTDTGQLYRCTIPITPWGQSQPTEKSECRVESQLPTVAGGTVQKPCNRLSMAFSIFTNAPRQTSDCVEFHPRYPDGYGLDVAALDNEGNLWGWYVITSAEQNWVGVGAICLGPLITMAVGSLLIGLISSRMLTKKDVVAADGANEGDIHKSDS